MSMTHALRAVLLGITATPFRLDGSGLGRANFVEIIEGPSMSELIAQGHLVPMKYCVAELIDTCVELSRERQRIAAVVAELPDSFSEVRAALNELHRILIATQPAR